MVVVAGAPARASDPASERQQVQRQRSAVAGQLDALQATAAEVRARRGQLAADLAGEQASLVAAEADAARASAAARAAQAAEAAAQAKVAELHRIVVQLAVVNYVHGAEWSSTELVNVTMTSEQADALELRNALLGVRARHDDTVLGQLVVAQQRAQDTRRRAQDAATAAEARKAEVASRVAEMQQAHDTQASFIEAVERRLDNRLAEAQALAAIDATLSAQIVAQEQAVANAVASPPVTTPPVGTPPVTTPQGTTPGTIPVTVPVTTVPFTPPTTQPPPPPGVIVVIPPRPAPSLATTHGFTVDVNLAPKLSAMLDAAAAAGITFTGSGWRSYDTQVYLRSINCGPTPYDIYMRPASQCSPPTARPGTSNHEMGLAVDLAANGALITSQANPGFQWLAQHAAAYGLYNYPPEPWHWSIDGY